MKKSTLVLFVFTVLVLGACSGTKDDSPSSKPVRQQVTCVDGKFVPEGSNGIIGGNYISKASWVAKTAVFLEIRVYSKEVQAYGTYQCTGILVDTDVVLTAAHCVEDASSVLVQFTTEPECDTSAAGYFNGTILPASTWTIHPDYGKEESFLGNKSDLAMIKIKGQAPADYRPTSLSKTYIDPKQIPLLAAGYGNTESHFSEGTLLRGVYLTGLSASAAAHGTSLLKSLVQRSFQEHQKSKPVTAEELSEFNKIMQTPNLFPTGPDKEFIYVDQSQQKGVCSGDSGGAAFGRKGEKYQVIGIASRVVNPANLNDMCGMIGAFTNTLYYKTWIDETYNSLKGNLGKPQVSLFK